MSFAEQARPGDGQLSAGGLVNVGIHLIPKIDPFLFKRKAKKKKISWWISLFLQLTDAVVTYVVVWVQNNWGSVPLNTRMEDEL